jgi:two-component system, LytTR family, response regulator
MKSGEIVEVLVVENEAGAAQALTSLLQNHFTNIRLLGICENIASATRYLQSTSPDIVFLDVELNGESGFDLFEKTQTRNFDVIFTTAFPNYAVRAIKYACLEYLLKPVQLEDLTQAMLKFKEKKTLAAYAQQIETLLHNLRKPSEPKLCIPVSGGFVYLNKSEIVMCEAEGNYTTVYSLGAEKLLCSKNIGSVQDMLDDENMVRCHKSYLININHVTKVLTKEDCRAYLKGGFTAEVSQRKKDELKARLEKITLSR